jgi:hypothetical protein
LLAAVLLYITLNAGCPNRPEKNRSYTTAGRTDRRSAAATASRNYRQMNFEQFMFIYLAETSRFGITLLLIVPLISLS